MKDFYNEIFANIDRILVVLAHPDDCEIVCGSTIARLIKDKKKVRLVVTTNGGKGIKDKTGISEAEFGNNRKQEQIKGALELGIEEKENFNLNLPDGEVEHNLDNIGMIVYHIREFKPDIIITHNPSDEIITFSESSKWVNHRDHRNTGLNTLDAAYPYSRDNNFFPEQLKQGLKRHEVYKFLFTDSYTKPYVVSFDTHEYLEAKRNALRQHSSAIKADDIEDYVSEMKQENGYFELLGFVKIY
jgi:LmbE family N-acetylglucosaminyl deacetylase